MKGEGKRKKAIAQSAARGGGRVSGHGSRGRSHGFFVTGTDTGVGKTLVACALLRRYATQGLKVVGMKPVASGAERRGEALVSADVEALIDAGNVSAPRSRVNPYCFEPAIAPHIAARQAAVTLSPGRIERAFRALTARAHVVIVEGVGGFRVPLSSDADLSHLARRLGLPVILVVGLRLGCLSHALLAAESIAARGLTLAGWVANQIDPDMAAVDANVGALRDRLPAPLLAHIPYLRVPNAVSVAAVLDRLPDFARSRTGLPGDDRQGLKRRVSVRFNG